MAAFDLNSLYFLKNAAPKAASFEELNAPTERGFNLGRAYNENYNRNSLQNLIAQREKEGIPYDRLSNEAAKWDLGAAQAMRNERRSSLEYNYKQSVAEFEQWRRNMARRICGLILQKADELNIPQERYDEVLRIAYSYVVTYDPELAQFLLSQATSRRAAQNRLAAKNNGKPVDLLVDARTSRAMASQYDPVDNAAMYWGLMNYAAAAEAVANRELEASRRLGERVFAEKNDVLRLLSNFKNRNKEIDPASLRDYALSDRFHLIAENEGIDENVDVSDIITPESAGSDGRIGKSQNQPKKQNKAASGNGIIGEGDGSIKSMLDPKTLGTYPRISKALFQKQFERSFDIGNAEEAIRYLQELKSQLTEDSARANKGAGKTEGTDKNYFELIDKEIAEREQIKAEVGEGSAARLFWKNLPARSRMASAKQFRQAGTFASGVVSSVPLSVVDNGLMVQSPDYVISEAMQKQSKLLNTDDGWTNLKTMYASSGNGFLEQLAKQNTAYDVVSALGDAVLATIRPMYNAMMKGKNEEEKAALKEFLASSYGWPNKLFKALEDPNGSLGTAEEIRKRAKYKSGKKKNSYFDENEQLPGEGSNSGSRYSVEDMF